MLQNVWNQPKISVKVSKQKAEDNRGQQKKAQINHQKAKEMKEKGFKPWELQNVTETPEPPQTRIIFIPEPPQKPYN